MRKKVLLVAPYFPPHVGGAENYVYHIGCALAQKHGWDVVVVTSNTEGTTEKCVTLDGMKVYAVAQ